MFVVNGVTWRIARVSSGSACLKRSDGSETVGVTDGNTFTIYISNRLRGAFLRRVMAHELCHVFCMSYNIIWRIGSACTGQSLCICWMKFYQIICYTRSDNFENVDIVHFIMFAERVYIGGTSCAPFCSTLIVWHCVRLSDGL